MKSAIAALLLTTAAPGLGQAQAPQVAVSGGTVAGSVAQNGDFVFLGIPFAAPPLGHLRWRAPQPHVGWEGVLDASDAAPACLQNLEGWNRSSWLHASEDCLTLDIRTPALSGKRPVMVWIHGGSNHAGSSGGPADSNMTDQGVVHVGVQYRLGLLGFLSHRALAAEQGGSSGNYAIMDQIAALRWVRDNIASFSGDPENVTIYGESAGSQDVSLLLAAPDAQGLFDAAILQSGTPGFGMDFRPLEQALALGDDVDAMADAGGDIARLRALSPIALLQIQSQLTDPNGREGVPPSIRTTIDGKVLPEAPDLLLAKAPPVPVIIGTDKVEFEVESEDGLDYEAFARKWFEEASEEALAAYLAETDDPRRGNLATRMQSDQMFHCPADKLADLLAANGWPVWRYEFDMGEDGGLTRHAYEIGFILAREPVGGGVQMQDYWASLALAGDPNASTGLGPTRPEWVRWTPEAPVQIAFGEDGVAMETGRPRAALCRYTHAF